MTKKDKRVKFDFEIDFTNGGSLKGTDFRLDIYGETITDKELEDNIIADLRLLMVGEIKISNKEIITETHKRVNKMKAYDKDELEEANLAIQSLVIKCEKALLKFPENSSQRTLLRRRVTALKIAQELIIEKGNLNNYDKNRNS